MKIIKLIRSKPSKLQGEVNNYLIRLQQKFKNYIKIEDIKTLIVTADVEEACITIKVSSYDINIDDVISVY